MTRDPNRERPATISGLALLRVNPRFRRLWLARAISFLGDSLGLIALLLYTAHKTGNAFAVALLLLAGDFVPSLFSPVTGVLSDRLDRRALMVACELIRGGVIGTIAILQPALLALLILVGLQSVVAGAFQPASRAAVPHLVGDRDLAHANATIGFGTHGLEVIGPALAAIALPLLGLRGVLFVDAATFVLSAALLWRLPSLRGAKRERVDPLFAAAREGLIAIWNRPAVRAVAVAFFLVCAFTAIDDVALVFLARDLKAGDAAISLLYAGAGSGLMIGLFVLTRWASRAPVLALTVAGFALSSTGNLTTGLAWAVPVAFLTQTVRGLGISMNDTGVNTLIQRYLPTTLQGRVFSNVYGSLGLAAGFSYLVGGRLVDALGPRSVFIGAGAGGLLTAIALALVLVRTRGHLVPHTS